MLRQYPNIKMGEDFNGYKKRVSRLEPFPLGWRCRNTLEGFWPALQGQSKHLPGTGLRRPGGIKDGLCGFARA
jgi:hypothetical protein